MLNTKTVSKEEKFNRITRFISVEQIRDFLSQNYSYGMIYDYLKRDTEAFSDDVVKIMTLTSLRNTLIKNGFLVNKKAFDKMPQYWKCQYKYPKEWTEEQIKQDCIHKSIDGQKITVEKRIKNNSYKNQHFSREWSPLCYEFYEKKGISKEESKKIINSICSSGANACLKTTQSPSTELKISKIIRELGIEYSRQYTIIVDKEKQSPRSKLIYDFFIPSKNLLIEVNGSYWHCDPRFFTGEQIVKFPSGTFKASDVWSRDKFKLDYAIERGYTTIVIWEYDINNNESLVKKTLRDSI